ncbi:metallophosphoesterase [Ekhidna sp.]
MTIQYASDLHLEMDANTQYLLENPIKKVADILILAGDITYLEESYLANKVLDQLSDTFDEVLMIPGNHEFYRFVFPIENIFPDFEFKIRNNITYYNNKVIVRDNVRMLMSTLFSKVSEKKQWSIERMISDFHVSKYYENTAEKLSVNLFNTCHDQCKKFLQEELLNEFDGKTVIVTHHVPYNNYYIKDYPRFNHDLSEAFHVNMVPLMDSYKIDHWISGHTHVNHESLKIESTMVHTNQLGYVETDEHLSFDESATIEL